MDLTGLKITLVILCMSLSKSSSQHVDEIIQFDEDVESEGNQNVFSEEDENVINLSDLKKPKWREALTKYDTNKDGKLSGDELMLAYPQIQALMEDDEETSPIWWFTPNVGMFVAVTVGVVSLLYGCFMLKWMTSSANTEDAATRHAMNRQQWLDKLEGKRSPDRKMGGGQSGADHGDSSDENERQHRLEMSSSGDSKIGGEDARVIDGCDDSATGMPEMDEDQISSKLQKRKPEVAREIVTSKMARYQQLSAVRRHPGNQSPKLENRVFQQLLLDEDEVDEMSGDEIVGNTRKRRQQRGVVLPDEFHEKIPRDCDSTVDDGETENTEKGVPRDCDSTVDDGEMENTEKGVPRDCDSTVDDRETENTEKGVPRDCDSTADDGETENTEKGVTAASTPSAVGEPNASLVNGENNPPGGQTDSGLKDSSHVVSPPEDVSVDPEDTSGAFKDASPSKADALHMSEFEDISSTVVEVSSSSEDVLCTSKEHLSESKNAVQKDVSSISKDVSSTSGDVSSVAKCVSSTAGEDSSVSKDILLAAKEISSDSKDSSAETTDTSTANFSAKLSTSSSSANSNNLSSSVDTSSSKQKEKSDQQSLGEELSPEARRTVLVENLSDILECSVVIAKVPRPTYVSLHKTLKIPSLSVPVVKEDIADRVSEILKVMIVRQLDKVKYAISCYDHCEEKLLVPKDLLLKEIYIFMADHFVDLLVQEVTKEEGGAGLEEEDLWSDYSAGVSNAAVNLLSRIVGYSPDGVFVSPQLLSRLLQSAHSDKLLSHLMWSAGRKLKAVRRVDELIAQEGAILRALEILLSNPATREILSRVMDKEVQEAENALGNYFEKESILSPLLSVTTAPADRRGGLVQNSPATRPFTEMKGFPRITESDIGHVESVIQEALHRCREIAFTTLKKVLTAKASRESGLAWIASVVSLNEMRVSWTPEWEVQVCCSDGFVLNFCAVLVELFLPAINSSDLLAKVDLAYSTNEAYRLDLSFETCLAGGQIVSENTDQKRSGPLPVELQGRYNFLTECYHLTQRALSVGVLTSVSHYNKLHRDVKQTLQQIEGTPQAESMKNAHLLLTLMWQVSLLDPELVRKVSQFYICQSQLLLKLIDSTEQGDNSLKGRKKRLSRIPEFCVKDMAMWFRFVAQHVLYVHKDVLSGIPLSPFVDCCVALLAEPELMPGPVSATKVVSVLFAFMFMSHHHGSRNVGWGSNMQSDLAIMVLSCPSVTEQLGPALIRTYVSVDVVEGLDVDRDEFDKYSARMEISQLLKELMERRDSRTSILNMTHTKLFQDFLGSVLATLLYLLNDSLIRLANVRKLQVAKDNAEEWQKLTFAQKAEKEKFLAAEEGAAKNFMTFANHMLSFVDFLTKVEKVSACFTKCPLSVRSAKAILGFLDSLCGTKSKDLKVKNMEKYSFDPQSMLKQIVTVILRIAEQDSSATTGFVISMATDADFSTPTLEKAFSVISRKNLAEQGTLEEFQELIGNMKLLRMNSMAEESSSKGDYSSPKWQDEVDSLTIDGTGVCEEYKSALSDLRFGAADLQESHSFQGNTQALDPRSPKIKALMKEMKQLRTNLPIHPDASIFVRQDEERIDLMRAVITGPVDTPYSLGCFAFDIYFPNNYPNIPPLVKIITTGNGTVRFNPNLYSDGKVCLSLLGTWHAGDASEKWSPTKSSIYQIMGRKKSSARRTAQIKRLRMQAKRAESASAESASESIGPWEPVHEVDKSLGSRMPTPSGSKFLNAGVLSTHSGSLSIPDWHNSARHNRGVPPRSDSLNCVCTPPSVPLSRADSAGQTKATDQRVSLPECNSGSEIMRKVEGNLKQRTIDETLNETLRKPHASERSINQTQNISPQSPKKIHQSERLINQTPNISSYSPVRETHSPQLHKLRDESPKHTSECISEDMDVIYVCHKEPEIYKFNPLNTSSKNEIIKLININTEVRQELNVPNREVLGTPTKTHPTTGDGNCFFRALSYTLTGTEQYYRLLRNKIVHHMLDNAALYNCHLRSGYRTVSNYVEKKRMLRDRVWATEVEILAAADLLNTDLFIFEESNASWIKFSPTQVHGDCADLSKGSIYLVHKYQAHYDVVVDVFGEENVETFAGNKQKLCLIIPTTESECPDNITSNSCDDMLASHLPPPIQGHFDQSNPRFLNNAGKQCVMNSLSALIYSQQKPTISWTADDVDQILTKGNEMYESVQKSGNVHHDFLLISDIPTSMEYNGISYDFTFSDVVMGTLGGEPLEDFNFYSLSDALRLSLLQNTTDAAFVTFRNSTFIIIKQNDLFCVSDSHTRSTTGTVCSDGSSTVIHYSKIEDVFHHTLHLAESMEYTDSDPFEVTAVNVNKVIKPDLNFQKGNQQDLTKPNSRAILIDTNSRLQLYLIDQKQKLAKKAKDGIHLDIETSVSECPDNITSNSCDVMLASHLPPPIQGHFDQSDSRFLNNAGKQCVMNSLSALIYSQQKPTISWTADDVDQILTKGNEMYESVQKSGNVHHDFLLISDIPTSMEYNGISYDFTFSDAVMGTLGGEPMEDFNFYSLSDALRLSLLQNTTDAAFVTFRNSTFIIIKQNDLFCVSDSHTRSTTGTVSSDGSSTVIHYSKIEDVFHHTLHLAESMAYTDSDPFEVTAVNVNKVIKPDLNFQKGSPQDLTKPNSRAIVIDTNSRLQQYLIDQKQKLAKKARDGIHLDIDTSVIPHTRKEYMRLYRKKKRQTLDEAKKRQLQEADRLRKQKARADPQLLKYERNSKMITREKEPEKYRNIDLASKRKLRNDPEFLKSESKSKMASREREPKRFRDIELTSKHKLRKDPEFLKSESKSKMASRKREPNRYKDIDLASKRKLRKDPEVLKSESKSKMASRKREPNRYKDIDLASKRKLRKDPEVLMSESKSKMASRKREPKRFRDIELTSKHKLRKDPELLKSESKSKMASRKREPNRYKDIDLASKRKLRKDPEVLKSESKSKMASRKREPNRYRHIDLTSKHKLRKDPEFLKSESKSKMASRKREPNRYRDIDLASKHRLREDPEYVKSESKSKMASRDKEPEKYKRIDLLHKKNVRSNPLVLEKERLAKKNARLEPHFLKAESERDIIRKQRSRLNKAFLEQERLKQSERRNNRNTYKLKYQDRKRKAIDRSDSSHSRTENEQGKQRKYGKNLQQCIHNFYAKIERGPEYVCTSCHQTWFKESVSQTSVRTLPIMEKISTGYKSVNEKEWICNTCLTTLRNGKVPKLSVANGMKWPEKPPQLNLHPLEERLVALRIPFMQIRELPRGGQYSSKGNVVNIPIDLQPTVNALPRRMDEHFAIPVKLKKRISHKSHVFSENVRPHKVLECLHWLMNNSDLYKNSGVKIDSDWVSNTLETSEEIVREFTGLINAAGEDIAKEPELSTAPDLNSASENINPNFTKAETQGDSFDEINEDDCIQGNSDTLIDEADLDSNKTLVLAPGENQKPLSLYHDKDAETLSFPTIYCGQKRLENADRKAPVAYSDIAKWELRSVDRRAARCVPNIFFKLHKIQRKQVADKVNLAMRRKKTEGKKITAKEARNPETSDKIVSLNEGYYIFRTLRNSPAYLSSRKKDVFAMIRQLGLPTWFMSLSCADSRWPELLKTLAAFSGLPCSDEDISNMTWNEKTKLVQKDPVTACRYFDHRVQVFMNNVLKSEHSPIGVVTDSFQGVEFQNRGSPHVHMMIWIKNAPKYQEATDKEIIQFVEEHISCSQDVDEDMQDLIKIQTHKHSKTCKKGGRPVCRFGFPLPPLNRTMVLEPLEIEIEKYKKKYKELHARMNDLKDECNMSYEEFLKTVVQMEEEDYIKCIRSSLKGAKVFLKRNPSEMRVNYYNKTVLKAWKANIDLQFVLDPYACAMYIVSYISKSQRGMSTMLEQASKEAAEGNMDLKRQVRHIGNKFLNFVEVSAQEAAYLVLQMPLTRSSRHVVFINTSPPEERVFLLKTQEELEELPDNSTDIQSDNIMKRYAKRPKQLENYCLADYVSELKIQFKNNKTVEMECNEDDAGVAVSEDESGSDSESEFTNTSIVMKLRNVTIKRRKHPQVIRYVRYSIKTNAENFYREKLLLFMPWRCEEKDLKGGFSSYEGHFKHIREELMPVIQKYEHFIEELDLAREHAESDMDEFDTIAPTTEQTQAEDAEESISNSEEFFHFLPSASSEGTVDIGQDFGLPSASTSTETRLPLLSDDDYRSLIRSLNVKQREFFTHVVKWISTRNEPMYAFLSGGAGVGKSVVIRSLYQALHRQLNSKDGEDPDSIKILLTAFTGKAAFNINGSTIASAFHKKMFQREQHMHSDELNTFRTTYKDLKVIIIDEISMVGNKLTEFINKRLQELTGTKQDFGGISIIAVGDLYQLSPVADSWIFSDLSIGLAKNLWKDHFQMFELKEIMRQKDDLIFAQMLNRLRFNQLIPEDRDIIKSHMTSRTSANYPEKALHLFTENKKVDEFNNCLIQKLQSYKVEVKADSDIISPPNINKESKSNLIRQINEKQNRSQTGNLPSVLKLAVGMIYDVTVNIDVQDGLTNGSSSVIQHIEYKDGSNQRPAIVWVLFDDPKIGFKRRKQYKHLYHDGINYQWTPIFETKRTFLYNKKTYERIQFPLTPAAAKTVHKAQGTTVDELVVDLSSSFKAPHIHYVALSRVRKLDNLHITDFNEKALTVDEKVHKEMERLNENLLQICYMPLYRMGDNVLKILFHNTRSLHRHIEDVRKDPNILSADIIGLAESRLCHTDNSDIYQLPGFQIYRIDDVHSSQTRPTHGLVVYLKNEMVVNRIHTQPYNGIEFALIDANHKMTNFQVLVSIQSLIFTPHPLFNEPGYENVKDTTEGQSRSKSYNVNIRLWTVRHAMLGQLVSPPAGFEDLIRQHFTLQKDVVLKLCSDWLRECEDEEDEKRLRAVVNNLRKELEKLGSTEDAELETESQQMKED